MLVNTHRMDNPGQQNVQTASASSSSQSVESASTASRTSVASIPITSPEKKRIRSTDLHQPTTDVQDQSAQYNESTPVDPDL